MYKLFLCFRYLTRKGIVIFPILAVWLCVAMLIVVNSIMTGFVDRVRTTGQVQEGDVIISSQAAGFPYYEELEQKINQLPQVSATSPVIITLALLNVPESEFNRQVSLFGIDPASESKVSSFRKSLFWQYQAPMQTVEDLKGVGFPVTQPKLQQYAIDLVNRAMDLVTRREKAVNDLKPIPQGAWFAKIRRHWQEITKEDEQQAEADLEQANIDFDFVYQLPTSDKFASAADLTRAMVPTAPTFAPPPQAIANYPSAQAAPQDGCIIGVDLGFYTRDRFGNYHRPGDIRFMPVVLTVVPVTMRSTLATPQTGQFMIVDDSHTQVYSVDSQTVYAPFDVVQKLAFMQQQDRLDGTIQPARCSAIQILVKNDADPQAILAARDVISNAVNQFETLHPDVMDLNVQTWDQMQAEYIRAVDNERNLIMFILILMSLVVIVVIFLIFFMMVRDKTRDIGIIKAIGGSELGVGAIFILYGVIISTIGSLAGMATGVLFVLNDNWIHDNILWRIFGITIWDRSIYVFSEIPHHVDPFTVAVIVGSAIFAGLLGAAIPAMIAGRQDPVESLRYE